MSDPVFRFLSNEAFGALDVKGKAGYVVRAMQELEKQQTVLRDYHEALAAQVAAIVALRDLNQCVPGSRS